MPHDGTPSGPAGASAEFYFFTTKVDGRWHNGWFRIRHGQIEVMAEGRSKVVEYVSLRPEDTDVLVRALLTEIVREQRNEEV